MKRILLSFFICLLGCAAFSAWADEPAVIEIKNGEKLPQPTAKKAVVIDFNASWCMPCRMFKPAFDRAAKDFKKKAKFVSVDIDANTELATEYAVKSIPYVVVLRQDKEPVTHLGAMTYDDFRKFLDEALK